MRRFYDSDLAIIVGLLLAIGVYNFTTNSELQAGFMRMLENVPDVSQLISSNNSEHVEPEVAFMRNPGQNETFHNYQHAPCQPGWNCSGYQDSSIGDGRYAYYPTNRCSH